jgi:hypothetical protein
MFLLLRNSYQIYIYSLIYETKKCTRRNDIGKKLRVTNAQTKGGFIKDKYFSWVQYKFKSGPGRGPSM